MLYTMLNWDAQELSYPVGYELSHRGYRVVVCLVTRKAREIETDYTTPTHSPGFADLWVLEDELDTAIRMARAAGIDHLICTRLEEHFRLYRPDQITIDGAGGPHERLRDGLLRILERAYREQRLRLWVQYTGALDT